jgi:speckle-type POZ protein
LAFLDVFGKKFRALRFHKEIPFPKDWGCEKFILKSELENPSNNLLPDDKLTILCRIEKTDSEECDCPNEDVQTRRIRRRLVEDYATLLERETTSDVHFIVQNQKIPAHKTILVARSPVFAAMFQNEMQEKSSNEVVVTDMEPDALKLMLQFIYTGHCQIGAWTEDLFFAADKYDIKDLKEICEEELRIKLCVDNAIRFLILSDLHRATKLNESSISFINQNAVEIMKQPAWDDLMKTHPLLVGDLYRKMAGVQNQAE